MGRLALTLLLVMCSSLWARSLSPFEIFLGDRTLNESSFWQIEDGDSGVLFEALGNRWVSGQMLGEGEVLDGRIVGHLQIEQGHLAGLDFGLLYCQAAAFAQGRAMPTQSKQATQSFERLSSAWQISESGWQMGDLNLSSGVFVLQGVLKGDKSRLRGNLSLNLIGPYTHPCGIDDRYQAVTLPLSCADRGRTGLHCSLNLRKLGDQIDRLASIPVVPPRASAAALEPKSDEPSLQKRPAVQSDRDRFRHRVIERGVIEEQDLRTLIGR